MPISFENSQSEMQGKLFELSGICGYDSEIFIKTFMNSSITKGLDSKVNFMQWCGKEYILERMEEEFPEGCVKGGKVFSNETLYWMGYIYRYWHFFTGENSKQIYKIADANYMNKIFFGYHTLDLEMAIDRIKESKQ